MVLLLKRILGRYKSSFAHVQNETWYVSSHSSNNPLCHSQTLWESTILITLKGLLFVIKLRKVVPCLYYSNTILYEQSNVDDVGPSSAFWDVNIFVIFCATYY